MLSVKQQSVGDSVLRSCSSYNTSTSVVICFFHIFLVLCNRCDNGLHRLPQSTEGVLKNFSAILHISVGGYS